MKRFFSMISFLIVLGVTYWSFSAVKPIFSNKKETLKTNSPLDNTFHHLMAMNKNAYYFVSKEHKLAQNYIVDALYKMGLEIEI